MRLSTLEMDRTSSADMSPASCLLNEDQFLCSICLDVFNDPVSTPCGHNYCQRCITEHWSMSGPCQCPNCKKVFTTTPELQINTFISELVDQFRAGSRDAQQHVRKAGGTPVQTGTRRIVLTSCLVCLVCVCLVWMLSDAGRLREEGTEAELENPQTKIQQMRRRLKMEETKRRVELSEEEADRAIAAGVQFFTALKESVKRSQTEFINTVMEKQGRMRNRAEVFITELQQEISELNRRGSESEHLLLKDWTDADVSPPSYEGMVASAVVGLEETLDGQMKQLFKAELRRVQQYEVDVMFDPDTAHPQLVLSNDGKQVKLGEGNQKLPDNPERFDHCANVLAKQSFSSGKFYYEVQVKGKTNWDLGVGRESMNRKGKIILVPQNGYWTMWLRNGNVYEALVGPSVRLSLKSQLEKVGVFVDYEEGLVSFYDVNAAALIYSFTNCNFTERLFLFFSPSIEDEGRNSAPLIITAVSRSE